VSVEEPDICLDSREFSAFDGIPCSLEPRLIGILSQVHPMNTLPSCWL